MSRQSAHLGVGSWHELGRVIVTLAISAAGGLLATLAGMPAGWISGGLLAVALVSLAGFDTSFPRAWSPPVYLVLGLFAGGGVSHETLHQMHTYPVSFAILGLSLAGVVSGSSWYLIRRCDWARNDALLSSLPGALSFVVAAAEGLRADLRKVAIAQSIRLIILMEAIPLTAFLIGHSGAMAQAASARPVAAPAELLVLVALGTALGALAAWMRVPAGWIIGGMVASAGLLLTGQIGGGVPGVVQAPASVALAAITGSRFRPGDNSMLPKLMGPALGAFAIAIVFSSAGAVAVTLLLGVAPVQTLLAFAPGALEGLILLATQMDVDPAYVAAHHVVRFVALLIAVPILARWMARGSPPTGTPSGPPEQG